MYNADGEFVREIKEEKTVDEMGELLSGYRAKRYSWWRLILCVLTVAAVVLMVKTLVDFGEKRAKAMLSLIDPMEVMLEGDYVENEAEMKFESEPTNQGYFMHYVLEEWANDEITAEELLKMASEVDPENALYHYLAAGKDSREVVEKQKSDMKSPNSLGEKGERYNRVTEYEVLDREGYDRAMEHLIEAGKRGGIIDHTLELRVQRLAKVRKEHPQDFIGRNVAIAEAFGVTYYSIKLLYVSDLFSAKFYELSKNGTEAEVRFWKNEHQKLLDTLLESDGSLVDMLVAKAIMKASLPNMRAAASRLGMDEEVEKMTNLLDVLFIERGEVRKRRSVVRNEERGMTYYSKLGLINELSDGPVLSHLPSDAGIDVELDPTPGRLVEHALVGRILVTLSFVLIGFMCIGMWTFYGNKSKEIRVMSNQVLNSLSLREGAFIVLGGVIFPILTYVVVNERTVLGVREWCISSAAGLLLLIQFFGMLITVFSLSSVLLRWRLSKRLPEISKSVRGYQWLIPCAAFIAMLLVGLSDSKEEMLAWAFSFVLVLGATLAWVGVSLGQCFFNVDQLMKLSVCRGLLSLYAVALVFMVGMSFYYYEQEFQYVAEDESFSLKEEHLGLSVLEYRVAQKLRENLRRQLNLVR